VAVPLEVTVENSSGIVVPEEPIYLGGAMEKFDLAVRKVDLLETLGNDLSSHPTDADGTGEIGEIVDPSNSDGT